MKNLFVMMFFACGLLSAGTPAINLDGPSVFSAAQDSKAQWFTCTWKNHEKTQLLAHLSSPTGLAMDAGILADGKRYNQIDKLPIDGSAFSVQMTFRLTSELEKLRMGVLFCFCTDQSDKCRLRFSISYKGELEVDYKIAGDDQTPDRGFNEASEPLEWRVNTPYSVLFTADKNGHLYVYRNGQPVIAQDDAPLSVADLLPRREKTKTSLLSIGFDPIYAKTFYCPIRAIISQFAVYESVEKPEAVLPSDGGQRVKHLVVDGSWSLPFDIREVNGELLGTFVRVDEKFYSNAARVRLTAETDQLVIEMKCPIPPGMKTVNTPGNFWREDRIEFFLRPNLSSPAYYQFAATPDGQTYVGCGMQQLEQHSSKFTIDASSSEYSVKVTIPFSELGLASLDEGMMMTGNFHRCGPTAGGISSVVLCSDTFHTPDDFIPIIIGSAKAYFKKKAQSLKQTTSAVKMSAEATSELAALETQIDADGDKAECFQAIEAAFVSLDNTLLALSLEGTVQMLWQPDVWSNRMLFNKLARPLTKLHVRMPRNSKKYVGFAFSNLISEKYIGQVKIAPEWPLSTRAKLFDNMSNWPEAMRNIGFYEVIASDDMGGKPCYDALSPLPMGTVLRIPGRETLPLWMEFSSKGMAAGLYHWKIVFKASRRPVEVIDLEWEIVDIDLDEQQEDATNYTFIYKRCWDMENLRKMWVEQGYTILLVEPGYPNMHIYGSTKADGTYVPGDMKPLDEYITQALAAGLDANRMKIMFSVNWIFNFGGNPDSDGWSENMANNLKQWVGFLQERFQVSPERIIIYSLDEPNGDIHDPKTSMHKAWIWGKLIRKAVPQCRLLVNPFAWEIDDNLLESYRLMAEDYDIFEPYRPSLGDAKFLAFIKSLNREIWTYDILSKSSSPDDYRHNHWRNGRDELFGITNFWSLDDMAGGDGFDPLDVSDPTGRQSRTDYGMAYLDFNLGTYLSGRRLIASHAGWYEMRLARLCRKMISSMPAAKTEAFTARLNKILADGSDGDGRVMDALSEKLLDLAIELKTQP